MSGHVALVVTAAPLARQLDRILTTLTTAGWRVTVCPTEAARDWIPKVPDDILLSQRIRPDAVICCPATFNTLNKWAAGINDSPALGVLNDAIGLSTPILAVPMAAERLTAHPAWEATLTFLRRARVDVMELATGQLTPSPAGVVSGTGEDVAQRFDPELLLTWLEGAHRGLSRAD
ncbi:MAG TPA: flavoprotein [Propionibacteriaceae bacterium]|nr:flavoprotein [Propionibacteriaceae bacterium]